MNAVTGYRVLALAGLVLAAVMMFLMKQGTYNLGLFVFWGVLLLAGLGAVGLGMKLDGAARARQAEADRQRRLSGR